MGGFCRRCRASLDAPSSSTGFIAAGDRNGLCLECYEETTGTCFFCGGLGLIYSPMNEVDGEAGDVRRGVAYRCARCDGSGQAP